MTRVSNRERILAEGLKYVHAHGFANAGVRDIVAAAGVPQGSFTNHFESKEAFGLELLERYYAERRRVMAVTLLNASLPPMKRLRTWLDSQEIAKNGVPHHGCLIGNFIAEASNDSDAMRLRLGAICAEIKKAIADCLKAAVRNGELPRGFDCTATADFIFSGLQGATLVAKAERNPAVIEHFKKTLFAKVLH